jgi:hypothetical protein
VKTDEQSTHELVPVSATLPVTARDFMVFQVKLLLDGTKDVVLFQLAVVAILVDMLTGNGRRPRFFYQILQYSDRFDRWLALNGPGELLEQGGIGEHGLYGSSTAGADRALRKLVHGKEEPLAPTDAEAPTEG